MKARSLVFDLFGDYLRYRGGAVRLRALVALMECFDVPEPTVRVVAARMRKEGWLESHRDGRETTYVLTDATWRLLDEGRERIFARAAGPWDGRWHMAIYQVPESERALREQLRKQLSWLGFGALAPSVWVSPHDRTAEVRQGLEALGGSVRLDVFHARSEGADADRDMANRAWDLAGLDRDYTALLETYRPRLAAYREGLPTGREALVERMRLISDYRLFPFRDPDLPPELLPAGWSGRAAHEAFLQAHGLLRAPAEAFVDEVLGVLEPTS
ncbi:PaaX family transcriptional regulator [Pseudonocardia sp.]|uniref:PaaX family transcriptional regulator n=1 Tax=Pseudonocardia sp. TaxID=60912 RepID=UPI003D0D2230